MSAPKTLWRQNRGIDSDLIDLSEILKVVLEEPRLAEHPAPKTACLDEDAIGLCTRTHVIWVDVVAGIGDDVDSAALIASDDSAADGLRARKPQRLTA